MIHLSDRSAVRFDPIRSWSRVKARNGRTHHDKRRYRQHWLIEATFCRLTDFPRIVTRYDKLARNYASAVASPPLSGTAE